MGLKEESAKLKNLMKKLIKECINEEEKSCFRLYKAIVKTVPNGSTCGVQVLGDDNIINLRYSSAVRGVKVNEFVWVATIYKSFSNAIVFSTVDFNFGLNNDDVTSILLEEIFPVGSIYLSIQNKSPASFLGGSWEQITNGKVLQTTTGNAGQYLAAGLPNIYGKMSGIATYDADPADCTPGYNTNNMFKSAYENPAATNGGGNGYATIELDASRISDIYGKSTTVQPPAYTVYAWKRVA